MRFDATVGVIGIGAIGSQTLLNLALAGVSAVGFDRFSSPNDKSGYAGESRLIFTLPEGEASEAEERIQSSVAAAWDRFEATTGYKALFRNGALLIGGPDDERMIAANRANRARGGNAKLLDRAQISDRFPQFALSDGDFAVFDELGGGVRSEWAVSGAVRTAERLGAQIRTNEEVIGWELTPTGVQVYTTEGDYYFEKIVVTLGAYAASMLPSLRIGARKLVMAWFSADNEFAHMFEQPKFPVFSWVRPAGHGPMLYGAPSTDGASVKIGGDFDWGVRSRVDDEDFLVRWEDLAELRGAVQERFHHLSDNVVRSIKLVDGWSEDDVPIIGFMPHTDRVVVATGFSGYGFMVSPVVGEQVGQLVSAGRSTIDLAEFSPSRFLDSLLQG